VWPHSGHYRPTEQNFQEFMNFLKERSVDLTNVMVRSLIYCDSYVCRLANDPRRFS